MKYNTLLVPVVAFATFASALPSDASANAYPSDQGKYKHQAAKKQQGPLDGLPVGSQAKLAQGPVDVGTVQKMAPQNADSVEKMLPVNAASAQNMLPVNVASAPKMLPIDAAQKMIPANVGSVEQMLPVNPSSAEKMLPVASAEKMIPVGANNVPAPVDGTAKMAESAANGARPGFLPDLPIALPPKVPSMRRSRSHVVRDSKVDTKCGRLFVQASDNQFSGFVGSQRDEDGRYVVVKDSSKAVLVDLNGHDLIFRNMDMYPALGATFGVMEDKNSAHNNVQGNSANFAMLTGTSMTTFGKQASDGSSSFNDETGASQRIESAIFYFGENREMHASWINTNGQSIPLEFGVNPDKELIVSANVGQYAATYGGKSAKMFCTGQ